MRRRAVEIEVILLDIFAVVAFTVGQAEQALLDDRVIAVPQGKREAKLLTVIGNAGDPVLAPAIGSAPGLIVAEIIPGIPASAWRMTFAASASSDLGVTEA